MKRINVIDLDNTLIPYDSFRVLVKNELKKFSIKIWLLTFLRVARIISAMDFKKSVIGYFLVSYNSVFFTKFAKRVYSDIDKEVLNIIKSNTNSNTINILISASPDFYVKELIALLGWEGKGSYFDENKNFINLFGEKKIFWLKENFNRNLYDYFFAISDGNSDKQLLSLFQKSILWEKK